MRGDDLPDLRPIVVGPTALLLNAVRVHVALRVHVIGRDLDVAELKDVSRDHEYSDDDRECDAKRSAHDPVLGTDQHTVEYYAGHCESHVKVGCHELEVLLKVGGVLRC